MKIKSLVYAASVILCLQACSGGSSTTGASSNSSQLSGKIVTERFDQLWQVDLPAGRFSQIQHTAWDEDNNFANVASFSFAAKGYEDNGFVLSVRDCLPENNSISCIVLLDRNGQRESTIRVAGRMWDKAKLSKDGRFIASVAQYSNGMWLQVFRTNGELVDESKISDSLVTTYIDWHPNGRIYFAQRFSRRIQFTEPDSAVIDDELNLPSELDGSIKELSISPDGRQIAFELFRESDETSIPLVLELESLSLTVLAFDALNISSDRISIERPAWSPDGNWILVTFGGATSQGSGATAVNEFGTLPFLFAVPSQGSEVPLAPYDSSHDTTAELVVTDAVASIGGSQNNADRWFGGEYYWLP